MIFAVALNKPMTTGGILTAQLKDPILWCLALFGLFIGSFLNVCILRIPEQTFWKSARSRCPHCAAIIPIWHNIPVLSWLLLRGKAACCGNPISWQYPVVELLTGILFAVVYYNFPFLIEAGSRGFVMDPNGFIRCVHMLIFTSLMIVVSVIDIRLQIIPDVISYPMIVTSAFWVMVHPQLHWTDALLGIVAGGGFLYAIAWIYFLIRKEYGMGFGDVKLLAAIGGWLGVSAVFPTLFFGSVLGTVFALAAMILGGSMNFKSRIPFGPFLAIGAFLYMTYGRQIMALLSFD